MNEKANEIQRVIDDIALKRRQRYVEIPNDAKQLCGSLDGEGEDARTNDVREGYGLVLEGGGGRGSYEIGVWKALDEYRDVIDIRAVSGSSVGALNAALYACGDLEGATRLWYDITNERILSGKDIDESSRSRIFESLKERLLSIDNPVVKNAIECIGLDAVAKDMKIKDGFFSREGLQKILENSYVLTGVSKSDTDCYATCLNVEGVPVPERFLLNGREPADIERILLASSAIPVIFPMETIDETRYYDGGFFLGGDNVPIRPLYDAGFRKFIVVHLDGRKYEHFDDAYMLHIYPSVPLGGAIDGMLDFSPEGVRQRLSLGYADAKAVIERHLEKLSGGEKSVCGASSVPSEDGTEDGRPSGERQSSGVVYLTRHGQTVWNVENKICGATDIELTELGHEQAAELGREIKTGNYHIDEILYSPLVRAAETARHISEETGISLRAEIRLTEQNFGRYEGTARNGLEFRASKAHFTDSYDGGESMARLCQRVYNLLDELREENARTGKTYLLVAHNGIARAVQSYFHDMSNEEFAAFGINNCEVREYKF